MALKSFHPLDLQDEDDGASHFHFDGVGNVGVYRLHGRRHRADELFTSVCGTLNDPQDLLNLLIVHPHEDSGVALAQEPSGTGQHRRVEPILAQGIDQPSHVLLLHHRSDESDPRHPLAPRSPSTSLTTSSCTTPWACLPSTMRMRSGSSCAIARKPALTRAWKLRLSCSSRSPWPGRPSLPAV